MSRPVLLVTGASGQLGRRVVELLLEQGQTNIIATTRDPDKLADLAKRGVDVRKADFEDPASLARAFAGAARALLVSTDALDRPGRRLAQHRAAIEALAAAGIKHIVYTSLPNPEPGASAAVAPDHYETERSLAASGIGYTALRNNLYIDLLVGALPGTIASGKFVNARGDGKASFVTREDCARAAAGALASDFEGTRTLDVTGPEAITGAELAAIIAAVAGKPVVNVPVDAPAFVAGLVEHGLPAPIAQLLASFDIGIAKGELANVSTTVKDLTGRPPQSVRDYLASQRGAFAS